jgi:drug/metabolite transporter (DMT)-like permease
MTDAEQRIATIKGILLMMLAMFLLVVTDAATKWLGGTYSIGEIVLLRNIVVILPIVAIAGFTGKMADLRPVDIKSQVFRGVLNAVATLLIGISMILLPLADAESLLFAAPLFVTLFSRSILGEAVGWRRMTAVMAGFVGVIIMLRPTPDLLQPAALLGVLAALTIAVRDLWTRRMAHTETSNAILLWSEFIPIFAAGSLAVFAWVTPTLEDTLILVFMAFCYGVAQYAMIVGFRIAEAATIAPFRYSAAIWAVLFGYLIWRDIPDAFVLTGGAIVIASGLYILRRETRRR